MIVLVLLMWLGVFVCKCVIILVLLMWLGVFVCKCVIILVLLMWLCVFLYNIYWSAFNNSVNCFKRGILSDSATFSVRRFLSGSISYGTLFSLTARFRRHSDFITQSSNDSGQNMVSELWYQYVVLYTC